MYNAFFFIPVAYFHFITVGSSEVNVSNCSVIVIILYIPIDKCFIIYHCGTT